MAKQDGSVGLRGRIEGIVFYKVGENLYAKGKGSLDKKRVMKDPAFEGSRRASVAFTRVMAGVSLVRRAMGNQALKVAETRMTGKLTKRMMAIIKTDTQHRMDERKLQQGDMKLLKGFPFNSLRPVGNVLKTGYKATIDRAAGLLEVSVPAFAPKKGLEVPEGATHFELIATGAALDFEKSKMESETATSGILALSAKTVGPVTLSCKVKAGSALPLVLGMGVVFYQEQAGMQYPLRGGGCFDVVEVEG